MVDLHVHSTKSDGTYSPRELVNYAIEKGLSAFALTDHDTVDGLAEAMDYAEELRKTAPNTQKVPEVIPGIEFSTEYHGRDIHIVGLYINYETPVFKERLQAFVDSRTERNHKMCRLLQQEGFDITYDKLVEEFPGAVITRAHYAKYLFCHNYVKSLKEAFDRYVGDNCPCFVPREKVTPSQAVELILAADGIPVLAHPILYRMSETHLEELVASLKKVGLMGIEAIYSTYNSREERQIRTLAQKYRLLISGGSDFHGSNKPDLDLGTGYGKLYLHDSILDTIKSSRKNLLFSDMDGTLLRSDCTISPAVIEALNRMTANGHRLILSSGRALPSILEVCETARIRYPHMYISANNGSLIYDCDAGKPIYECKLSAEQIAIIIAKANEMGVHIQGYTDTEIICTHKNAEVEYYIQRIHMPLKLVTTLTDALREGSYKLLAISLDDRDLLERFRDALTALDNLKIQTFFSNDYYLEILPENAGKGTALRFLTDYFPMQRNHTFAAGDAENDISMLQAAQVGIAMENATAPVKAVADIITAKSNNRDGILEILEKYF